MQTVEFWRNQDDVCSHGLDNCHMCLAVACAATFADILAHPDGEPVYAGMRWGKDVSVDESLICKDCGYGYPSISQARECSRRHHSEEAWRG